MIAMPQPGPTVPPDFAAARLNMIDGQLRPNGITDLRLLEAMGTLPREVFVPSTLVGVAYLDESIPLISGRALMQPMVLAKLIQSMNITAKDRVLDLAPATGYSTVVLAALAAAVVGVEPDAILHKEAELNLGKYAPGKTTMLAGAPVEGCISHPPHAPFDVILINGCVEFLPDAILGQLAEGGRLAVVMRTYGAAHASHTGQARLYKKTQGIVSWSALFDANVPPSPGFTTPQGFTF